MAYCIHCGTPLRAEAHFCTQCGSPRDAAAAAVPQVPLAYEGCPQCGAQLLPGKPFCPQCGGAVSAVAIPVAAIAPGDGQSSPSAHPPNPAVRQFLFRTVRSNLARLIYYLLMRRSS
jgi:predicted amidophosphoribosyltransferase